MLPEAQVSMLAAFSLVAMGTGWVRRYALRRQLLDIPNARSSHAIATPRGGGLAVAAAFALTAVAQSLQSGFGPLLLAVLPAVLLVALLGLWDDHRDLSVRLRLSVHFAAAAWAVLWVDGSLVVPGIGSGQPAVWLLTLLALSALVWFLNLFNFMDGIDGIAGIEAAFIAFTGAWLTAVSGQAGIATLLLILGSAVLGFLPWNWPPAKIFLGDVGSGFLGAALGVLGYAAAIADPALFWPWVILVAVFVTDATVTLLRRCVRGERCAQAHRSHAYQRAALRWGHRRVTLTVLLIDLAWLLPLAWVAAASSEHGALIALLAYMPLVLLALWFGAGAAETVEA